jgi:formylglycine-generating enzyme required for sulfatase activity
VVEDALGKAEAAISDARADPKVALERALRAVRLAPDHARALGLASFFAARVRPLLPPPWVAIAVPPVDLTIAGKRLVVAACGMDRTEVTNAQYFEFWKDQGYENATCWTSSIDERRTKFVRGDSSGMMGPKTWQQPAKGFENGYDATQDKHPVTGICLEEAQAYARWRSAKTGLKVSLPTADQFTVAAGYDPAPPLKLLDYPWPDGKQPADPEAAGISRTGESRRVDDEQLGVSVLGIVGLGGNVREWVFEGGVFGSSFVFGKLKEAKVDTAWERGYGDDRRVKNVGFRCAYALPEAR